MSGSRDGEKVLILDAGGVLVTEPMPEVLDFLAARAGCTRNEVECRYRLHLYGPFWRGDLATGTFWQRLIDLCASKTTPEEVAARFFGSFDVVPDVVGRLDGWAQESRLILLSNHRSEWLAPLLRRHNLARHFHDLIISDAVGCAKPEPRLFEHVESMLPTGADVLYVDDDTRNLSVGQRYGWSPLPATANTKRWLALVSRWLLC